MKVVWDGRYIYIYTNPDSYEPLTQVHNRINENGENCQQPTTSKELKAADKLISELKDNSQIMSLAKDQLKKALTDFEGDLNEPKSTLGKRI